MDGPAKGTEDGRAGWRILVVDDNHDSADMLAMLLRLEGHDCPCAYDGTSALEAARTLKPDAVLLDLTLPDLTGDEVASRIRESPEIRGTVIIAVSGYGPREDSPGLFDGHVVKPAEAEKILQLIARARANRT